MWHEHRPFSNKTLGGKCISWLWLTRTASPLQPLLGKRARCSQWGAEGWLHAIVKWCTPARRIQDRGLFPCFKSTLLGFADQSTYKSHWNRINHKNIKKTEFASLPLQLLIYFHAGLQFRSICLDFSWFIINKYGLWALRKHRVVKVEKSHRLDSAQKQCGQ